MNYKKHLIVEGDNNGNHCSHALNGKVECKYNNDDIRKMPCKECLTQKKYCYCNPVRT